MTIKTIGVSLKENILGAIAGGVVFYFGAKKVAKIEKNAYLIGLAAAGAIAGAMIQSKLKSKASIAPAIKKAM